MDKEFRNTILTMIIVSLVVCVIAVAFTALNGEVLYPWWLSMQRKGVEQSKSFTDSNNSMLQTYMLEYSRLDTKIAEAQGNDAVVSAYKSQQKAIITKMCTEISTMNKSTVNPDVLSFLNSNGGCR
jgi:hypothetical protein